MRGREPEREKTDTHHRPARARPRDWTYAAHNATYLQESKITRTVFLLFVVVVVVVVVVVACSNAKEVWLWFCLCWFCAWWLRLFVFRSEEGL